MKILLALLALPALLAGNAAAQVRDPCMEAYNAEIVAVEREAKAKQNVGSAGAKQRAALGAETRLEAAARQAKKCQEDAKANAGLPGAKPAAADADCKARVNARAAEIERRFGSSTLDAAQQSARREEEIRLQADLNECNRRSK